MTTITLYRNNRNPHKYLEVHSDGHSHWTVRQYIHFNATGVVNPTGDGFLHRWRKENLNDLLEDYQKVGIGGCCFKKWYADSTRTFRSKMLKAIHRNGR